jgi:superfamily II DNA or RNA helicase
LGLSATPFNTDDEDEIMEAPIAKYYGKNVGSFEIGEAIKLGVLSRYNYYFFFCPLGITEAEKYNELSDKIARAYAVQKSSGSVDADTINALLMKRARLIQGIDSKIDVLREALESGKIAKEKWSLYYCAEGGPDDEGGNADLRHTEKVSHVLDKIGIKCSIFDSKTKSRQEILSQFKTGEIDALVAMRCLDEGIDIPACKQAIILASTRNKRQFVQRRGRVLRKSPGKEFAVIYDFIPYIPLKDRSNPKHADRLLESELKRVRDFMQSADNFASAFKVLKKSLESLGYEHL